MNDTALQRIKENKKSKATELDLDGLELTEIPKEIREFTWLKTLSLSNNKIEKIEGLEQLKQLNRLFLSQNSIKKIEGLEQLNQLEWLYLENNSIKKIEGLEQLKQLQVLPLGQNKIKKIEGLEQLEQLLSLGLGDNSIQKIEGLEQLNRLETLFLSQNSIRKIEGLEQLNQLRLLSLDENSIQKIECLAQLKQLQILFLDQNSIQKIEGIEQLQKLQVLSLGENSIQKIEGLEQLKQLQVLDLSDTLIDDLRPLMDWLANSDGKIYWNPMAISFISDPDEDPESLAIEIELSSYKKTFLSVKGGLYLENCIFLKIPSPEWVQQGKEVVLDYLTAAIDQDIVEMNEAKVMVVGRPHAGKTSASIKLRDSDGVLPDSLDTTRGILVDDWDYQKDGVDYTAHIWDFGGQDVQYAIHQFFMTQRAIYLLVDCTRDPEGSSHLMGETNGEILSNYWLQTIKNLAKASPTFYLYNLYEPYEKNLSVFENLERQYGDFLYKYPFEVNLHQVSPANESGIQPIRKKLQEAIAELPNVGLVFPTKWAEVKEILDREAANNSHISLDRYFEICRAHGVTDNESALLISRYFHEIGSLIHYSDDPSSPLYKLIILQRKWATSATYQVILDQAIRDQNGIFTIADLQRIWADPVYKNMTSELLGLLQKFEICYELNNSTPKSYLIPQCLPERTPEGIDDHLESPLSIQFKYAFLPYGIINRLTVRIHGCILDQKVWKRGMVLQKAEGRALVEEVKNINTGFIRITVSGNREDRWYLQLKVMEELHDLNRTMNLTSTSSVMVPCTCEACEKRDSPYLHSYTKLVNKLKLQKAEEECGESPYTPVKILDLIDHAFFSRPEEVTQSLQSSLDFRGAQIGKLVMGDSHEKSQRVEAGAGAIVQVADGESTNQNMQNTGENAKKSLLEYFRVRQLIGWFVGALAAGILTYTIPSISAFAGIVFIAILGYGTFRSLTSDGRYIRNARRVLWLGLGSAGILNGLPAITGLFTTQTGNEENGFAQFIGAIRIDENPWITALILILTFGLAGFLFYKDSSGN